MNQKFKFNGLHILKSNILNISFQKIMLILVFIMMLLISTQSFASSNMNVIISSQTPDPVKPGNFVDVSIKITNQGSSSIQNAQIEVVENKFVTLSANQNRITRVGAIPAFSSQTDGFVIVRKRLFIDERAPIGEQLIEVKVKGDGKESSINLPIFIEETKPSLKIDVQGTLEDITYHPGELKPLQITLDNDNQIQLRNLKVTLQTGLGESGVAVQGSSSHTSNFFIVHGTNTQKIRNLGSQESEEITFNLGVSPNAQIRPYQIPLLIEYEDVLGNSFTEQVELSIIVNAQENVLVTLDRLDRNQVTFGIANPGPGLVRGAIVRLYDNNNKVIGTEYIGNLNADDFQTVQFRTPSSSNQINSDNSRDVRVEVVFNDGFFSNQEISEQFTLEPPVAEEQSSNIGLIIIVLLIVGVGGYFIIKRRNRDED